MRFVCVQGKRRERERERETQRERGRDRNDREKERERQRTRTGDELTQQINKTQTRTHSSIPQVCP